MTPLLVLAWFVFCIVGVYLGMRLLCFLKREYSQAENWAVRAVIGAISFLEEICTDCRKSCTEHPVLVRRAVRTGILIWAVSTAAWFLAHC